MNLLTRMNIFFEHELNELNEFLLKLATEKLFVLFGLFVFKKNLDMWFIFLNTN